jgi:hypothetical protein
VYSAAILGFACSATTVNIHGWRSHALSWR